MGTNLTCVDMGIPENSPLRSGYISVGMDGSDKPKGVSVVSVNGVFSPGLSVVVLGEPIDMGEF